MQAVIMAGGKGTRLSGVTKDQIPKSMIRLNGKPLLEYQVETLRREGIRELFIVTGHLHEPIHAYFGQGERWGVRITYVTEKEPLGTAGALYYLKDRLTEDFLLVLGDLIFDIDLSRMRKFHEEKKAEFTLFLHPNTHPQDSDLVCCDSGGAVRELYRKKDPREGYYENSVNAGIYILSPSMLGILTSPQRVDLEKDLLFPAVLRGSRAYGYRSPEYVRDAGTPERLAEVEQALQEGIVQAKNLRHPQRCVFLDRDGTLNRHAGLIADAAQLELEEGAAEAIAALNRSGCLAILVTNQPVIARNLCSVEELLQIHRKLETLLGEKGCYLDDIKYCPHHPDAGYPEERREYKIACSCRKPGTGMIEDCVGAYHIDRANSWMVGDSTTDVQTGKNAGLSTILLRTGQAGRDGKYQVTADFTAANLKEAVAVILEGRKETFLPGNRMAGVKGRNSRRETVEEKRQEKNSRRKIAEERQEDER